MPGKITLSLVLIALGILVLLRNIGQVSEGWWHTAVKLWPLILVFIGVEVMLTRRKGGGGGGKSKRDKD